MVKVEQNFLFDEIYVILNHLTITIPFDIIGRQLQSLVSFQS